MKKTGVAISVGANNSDFQKGMDAARAAAKALQRDLQAIKAPPLPDIGKQLGLQKKQIINPFGPEWTAGLQKGTAALKLELEKQAQAYREANRKMLPEINRLQMSGGRVNPGGRFDHLQGTQFEGGTRGAGGGAGGRMGNAAYGLGVGYNAIQDLVQGGPMAIANNIPQIIELVARSPALKTLGAAAAAAASSYFAYSQIASAYDKHSEGRIQSRRMQAYGQFRAQREAYQLDQDTAEGRLSGAAEGESLQKRAADRALAAQEEQASYARSVDLAQLQQESRRLNILAQKDQVQVQKDLAAFEIENLRRLTALESERARKEYATAEKLRQESENQYQATKNRIEEITEGNRRAGTSMNEREKVELERLQALLPGLTSSNNAANARAIGTRAALASAQSNQSQRLPLQEQIINQRTGQNITAIQTEQGRKTLDEFFNHLNTGLRNMADMGRTYSDAMKQQADLARRRTAMQREVEMAELQNSSPRKAEKMRKEQELQQYTDDAIKTGMTPEDAKKLARRKQRAQDRAANPRRIRGAGADQDDDDRPSGLDYLKSGRMGGPKTSALDEYEKRRSMPGVGKKLDQDMAEKEAAAAKAAAAGQAPAKTGDTTTHNLLKQMIDGISTLASLLKPANPPPTSAN